MLHIKAIIILAFGFLLYTQKVLCQSNKIVIRYIGNCGLHLTDGVTNIYTDFPYKSGAHHYATYQKSELDSLKENAYFIFTHKHSDHYYKRKMKQILKNKHGKKYGKWNISELENLSKAIPDFEIKTYKTKHLYSFAHYSYLITWHGKKIYFSGDTEHAETILTMKNLDWAFIPSWLVMRIKETNQKFDTKMIGIYHIGPKDKVNITGEKVLMLNEQGKVIEVSY